uniref:BTB domain-containing protein n=1 Tax=Panagrolaimus sp. ES5 TaxID=591445 RepID=A0AC34G7I4_9BILA
MNHQQKKTVAAKSESRSAYTEIIRAMVENSVSSNSHDSASVVTRAIVAPASETPTPTNAKDSKWSEILSDTRYADVILVCHYNIYKIPTYRCLLAKYSNVFEEIFKKSNELPVKINTGFDATTIKAALAFMLDQPYPAGNEIDTFKLAAKYGIQELMELHYATVEKQIDYTNVCQFIQIAYTQKIEKLKKHCLKLLFENKHLYINMTSLPQNILIDVLRYKQ